MKKKALCIGVAYTDSDVALSGAHNDALRMAAKLRDDLGYSVEILLDLESYTEPTRDNIKAAIVRLVEDAQSGDRLFFHFSGHGDQIPNLDNTEDDGKDEIILPSDWERDENHPELDDRDRYTVNGRILDDELHEWLVVPIPEGCVLNALFDNCHSGTVLDLLHRRHCRSPEPEYMSSPISQIFEEPDSLASPTEPATRQPPVLKPRVGSRRSSRKASLGIEGAMEIGYSVVPPGYAERCNSKRTFSMPRGRLIVRGESKDPQYVQVQGGNVYSWCACSDEQLAGETTISGKASGYMVDAFLACLDEYPTPTYEQLLLALNEHLRSKCFAYNTKPGRRPSTELIRQDPEFGSHLLPDMKATIVI